VDIVGRWVSIKCYKHNGTIHRFWDRGFVIENNDDYIVVATKKAKVIESNGRRWFTKEPAVTIFSKKEWWNVICMVKNEGICYYCNIASPAIAEKDKIIYIDYDLDTKLFPSGDIKVLDEREYAHHMNDYGYGEDLDKVLRYQTQEILDKMNNRIYPFVDEKIKEYYEIFINHLEKK